MKSKIRSSLRWLVGLAVGLMVSPTLAGADTVTTRFHVTGMICASCEQRVERALGKLDGVADVEASAEEEWAEVEHDGDLVDAGRLEEGIERLGYEASLEPMDEAPSEEGS